MERENDKGTDMIMPGETKWAPGGDGWCRVTLTGFAKRKSESCFWQSEAARRSSAKHRWQWERSAKRGDGTPPRTNLERIVQKAIEGVGVEEDADAEGALPSGESVGSAQRNARGPGCASHGQGSSLAGRGLQGADLSVPPRQVRSFHGSEETGTSGAVD